MITSQHDFGQRSRRDETIEKDLGGRIIISYSEGASCPRVLSLSNFSKRAICMIRGRSSPGQETNQNNTCCGSQVQSLIPSSTQGCHIIQYSTAQTQICVPKCHDSQNPRLSTDTSIHFLGVIIQPLGFFPSNALLPSSVPSFGGQIPIGLHLPWVVNIQRRHPSARAAY